ncbi:tolloid-like protein 2 [Branchiostoma lanceolatum]|uniref:tolloid-like protein 2 n=1 Tax=Branchiostoma lanceolatum TaxID=7740 RepID=UPI00345571B7
MDIRRGFGRCDISLVAIVLIVFVAVDPSFLPTATPTSAPGCGGALVAPPVGTVTSPNYPNDYGNDETCEWTFTVPEGSSVRLTFHSLNLEDSYDFLKIYDGGSDDAALLQSLTGALSLKSITSTSNQMLVRFTSDSSMTAQGFHFIYSDIWTEITAPSCEGTLTPAGGVVSSPNYPGHYGTEETCEWLITVAAGSTIRLSFDSFNTEESYDFLYIYDRDHEGTTQMQSFTGEVTWYPITSTSNQMLVRFTSDESVTAQGFQFSYTVSAQDCGAHLTAPPEGTVTSPNYPGHYDNHQTCGWKIDVPEGYYVRLTFSSFHLEDDFDFLDIYEYDDDGGRGPRTWSLTGELSVNPIRVTSNQMFVRFTSDESVTAQGFQFSYTASDPGCGGYLMAPPGGTLTSPNYPGHYGRKEDCKWTITVPEGSTVRLTFDNFDLDTQSLLNIYDGDSDDATLLQRSNSSLV